MKTFRTTKQNKLILGVVQKHCDHPTADEIYVEVRSLDGHISRGTVYRNLEKLCDTGSLLRVKVPGADRYDSRLEYHYHIVCTSCRRVFDTPLAYQSELDRLVYEKSGFEVTRHRTVFEGRCPACAEKQGVSEE